jgi:hypothetical protein
LIITTAPIAPSIGLKLETEGVGNTVKFDALVPRTPPTVTEIVPVEAPDGTTVTRLEEVDDVTTEVIPLNST